MIKKILLGFVSILLFSTIALANGNDINAIMLGPQPVNHYLSTTPNNVNYDLFAGLTLGTTAGMVKRDLKYLIFNCPQHETDNYSPYGVNAGISLGGGMILASHYYLGAELSAVFSSAEKKIVHGNYYFKQRQNHILGIDFVPGIKINKFLLLYGKIGVGHSNFKFTTNNSVEFRTDDWSKDMLGMRLGLGIKGFFSHHFSLAAEYVFTNYGSKSNTFVDTSIQPYTIYRNSYRIYTNQFDVTFAYHFI